MTLTSPTVSTASQTIAAAGLIDGPGSVSPGRALARRAARPEGASPERPGELRHEVAGHARPGKVAPHRESEAHARVEVRAGHGPHKQDDRPDHEPRRGHERSLTDGVPAEPGVDHPPARGHEHEEERAEKLTEEPAPLVVVVDEVEAIAKEARRKRERAEDGIGSTATTSPAHSPRRSLLAARPPRHYPRTPPTGWPRRSQSVATLQTTCHGQLAQLPLTSASGCSR